MATRHAACHCGQLRLDVEGDPLWVSLCHCLACQRRTGSAFGMQAGFARGSRAPSSGRYSDYLAHLRRGGPGGEARLPLLPRLRLPGSTPSRRSPSSSSSSVGRRSPTRPFRRPTSPATTRSTAPVGRAARSRSCTHAPEAVGRRSTRSTRPAEYGEAADRGRELLAAVSPSPAGCSTTWRAAESLAGRTTDAARAPHASAIDQWDGLSAPWRSERLRLRPDPRRARFPAADSPVAGIWNGDVGRDRSGHGVRGSGARRTRAALSRRGRHQPRPRGVRRARGGRAGAPGTARGPNRGREARRRRGACDRRATPR